MEMAKLSKRKKVNNNGYIMIYSPEHPSATKAGYMREHRLVMEKHLGRNLLSDEVPHHINGDTADNRIENLKLMKKGEHTTYHAKDRVIDQWARKQKACVGCGTTQRKHFGDGLCSRCYRSLNAEKRKTKRHKRIEQTKFKPKSCLQCGFELKVPTTPREAMNWKRKKYCSNRCRQERFRYRFI